MHPKPDSIDIVKAENHDIRSVASILGNAFGDDPVFNWISSNPKLPGSVFRFEAEALYAKHKHMYINKEKTGAAMWLPAGVSPIPQAHWTLINLPYQHILGGGLTRISRPFTALSTFSKYHPREDHFYLHAIGASRGHQGKGIGSALLKAGLADCDAQHMPAYLESTSHKNKALYERFGFEVIGKETLGRTGPEVWFMWREAR